jgi:hypothetical protein
MLCKPKLRVYRNFILLAMIVENAFNSDIRVGVYKRQDGRELEKGVECKIA